ncbi:MAG: hypothetical protein IKE08_01265, partial [Clostridia bacterium]|nr:hypothetical protein [Clostridia bacterium]
FHSCLTQTETILFHTAAEPVKKGLTKVDDRAFHDQLVVLQRFLPFFHGKPENGRKRCPLSGEGLFDPIFFGKG